ncbi:MAG: D-aminoacyl-tRNA deacylase [Nitriliruptoraceae bacterium]
MRALVQRVTEAAVSVVEGDDEAPVETGRIGPGLVAFVGVTHSDGSAEAAKLARKLAGLRIFADAGGAMNRSCAEVRGEMLLVSQFTLYGDARKGRRPSFVDAAAPAQAEPLVQEVIAGLRELGVPVATGRFRTEMRVALVNDGPVTLLVEV